MITTASNLTGENFHSALRTHERSAEIPEPDDIYGWLVGSWELSVFDHLDDGTVRHSNGEVHFSWVLEGRAIQDVWIMPRPSDRKRDLGLGGNRYGTTLRVWDASIRAWRITWINPVTNGRDELVGRRFAGEIVQIGTHSNGTPIRWTFIDITTDSFSWLGESLQPDGKSWKLEDEFRAKRIA